MKEKPVILITAGTEVFQKNRKWLFLYEEYALRIREIGGIPLMIADLDMPEEITALEQLADGLLLSGGGDVDPKWFGETDTQSGAVYDEKRDRMEIGMCRAFAAAKKPVLGTVIGALGALLSFVLSGVFVWGEYMPDVFLGMAMKNVWIYSFIYNFIYTAFNWLIAAIVIYFLSKKTKLLQPEK